LEWSDGASIYRGFAYGTCMSTHMGNLTMKNDVAVLRGNFAKPGNW